MRDELIQKLIDEVALTQEESRELDQFLALQPNFGPILARSVESPGVAWRKELESKVNALPHAHLIAVAHEDSPVDADSETQMEAFIAQTGHLKTLLSATVHDEPSIAWRSKLNEKLRAPKPRLKLMKFAPAATLAAAASAAVFFLNTASQHGPVAGKANGAIESQLVNRHHELVADAEIGTSESTTGRMTIDPEVIEWRFGDLDNL